jgi:hypothetical protein
MKRESGVESLSAPEADLDGAAPDQRVSIARCDKKKIKRRK